MEQTTDNYKEEIVIPIYDEDKYTERGFFKDDSDCRYSKVEKTFKYDDILAITTRESTVEVCYHGRRGGALIFVKGREIPYLAGDEYSVKEIYKLLNKNPLACLSGLNQIGSSKIYAKEGKIEGNEFVLSNGVRLYLTKDAVRKTKFIHYTLKIGRKLSCFFDTKKRNRKKYKNEPFCR